jgi:hypothetical protein
VLVRRKHEGERRDLLGVATLFEPATSEFAHWLAATCHTASGRFSTPAAGRTRAVSVVRAPAHSLVDWFLAAGFPRKNQVGPFAARFDAQLPRAPVAALV